MIGSPHPSEVLQARIAADLTQANAARLLNAGRRTFVAWERGERLMPVSKWRLFLILTTQDKRGKPWTTIG